MMSNRQNHGRAGDKRARRGFISERNDHRRMVGISKCMSSALRHRILPGMTDEWWVPAATAIVVEDLVSRQATFSDIQAILDG